MSFHSYERAVKLGRFQGTYDAWRLEVASPSRIPGTCAYISTLRLDKVIQNGQLVNVTSKGQGLRKQMRRFVLVNGHSVGTAYIQFNHKYQAPAGTLLRIYYDPEKHLLRFQTRDGEPLPQNIDTDLISRARWPGYRPLLVLAHSEGLISTIPDGHLPSFDLQTNLNSGYYVRANRTTSSRSTGRRSSQYQSTISLPDGLGTTNICFKLSEPEKFEYLRFFPYIHEDQTFRLWDIERGVDAPLSPKGVGPWDPLRTKKRFPGLFEHAKRLGYWKEF
ncbi:hypothetical protein FRC05_011407 [Tulasnella sp. 425]|nr:hypothetical protein FRC05_011407 [Tulasnella sp. 425]